MELHILELKKLPPEDQSEDGIIRWMRFLRGKSRKEFEEMAKKDEYIEEAYNELKKLSLDEQKRLEYELRQKAVRDHNMMMKSAEKRGLEIGEKRGLEIGEKRGIEIGKKQGERIALKRIVENQMKAGKTAEETAELLGLDPQEVKELTEE
jgi:predicted transposase/invertase (TIGR01784 family)